MSLWVRTEHCLDAPYSASLKGHQNAGHFSCDMGLSLTWQLSPLAAIICQSKKVFYFFLNRCSIQSTDQISPLHIIDFCLHCS